MKRIVLTLIFLALLIAAVVALPSCMNEEDYYDKTKVDSLIAEIEEAIKTKTEANEAAITLLTEQYTAKIAELEAKDTETKNALDALTAQYNAKVAELEGKANATNADTGKLDLTKFNKSMQDAGMSIEKYRLAL